MTRVGFAVSEIITLHTAGMPRNNNLSAKYERIEDIMLPTLTHGCFF